MFESSVNSYDSQTEPNPPEAPTTFESSVNSYDSQTMGQVSVFPLTV